MQFLKSRFVAFCQQLLVGGVVLAAAFSAAGVMTLQIAPPRTPGAGAPQSAPSLVETGPVDAKIRNVAFVSGQADVGADQGTAMTEPTEVEGFATVGVTWDSESRDREGDLAVEVRTLERGEWSEWTEIEFHDDHQPDPGTPEAANAKPGTEPIVIGEVDQVQVRAKSASGEVPEGMEMALIEPEEGEKALQQPEIDTRELTPMGDESTADEPTPPVGTTEGDVAALSSYEEGSESEGEESEDGLELAGAPRTARPQIFSRAQWGANESWVRETPKRGEVRAGFVHHTVSSNGYSREAVPGIIQSIYKYHVKSRGWSDIGYNFLVDRFGRVWEGRRGGVAQPIIGAHTQGYNEQAFAISAIGGYHQVRPSVSMIDGIAKLMAWKLSLHGRWADQANVMLKGKYFHAINGHRDAGSTACPGAYLYEKLGEIRSKAKAIQRRGVNPAAQPVIAPPQGLRPPGTKPDGVAKVRPGSPVRVNFSGNYWPDIFGVRGNQVWVSETTRAKVNGKWATRIRETRKTNLVRQGIDQIIQVGDWDGDGHSDIMIRRNNKDQLILFRGNSRGEFVRGRSFGARWGVIEHLIGGLDVTGDGKPDLIGRRRAGGPLLVWPGKGLQGFDVAKTLPPRIALFNVLGEQPWPTHAQQLISLDGSFVGVSRFNATRQLGLASPADAEYDMFLGLGDLNGDHVRDLLARSARTGKLWLLPGKASGGLGPRVLVADGWDQYSRIG